MSRMQARVGKKEWDGGSRNGKGNEKRKRRRERERERERERKREQRAERGRREVGARKGEWRKWEKVMTNGSRREEMIQ